MDIGVQFAGVQFDYIYDALEFRVNEKREQVGAVYLPRKWKYMGEEWEQ